MKTVLKGSYVETCLSVANPERSSICPFTLEMLDNCPNTGSTGENKMCSYTLESCMEVSLSLPERLSVLM